MNAACKTISGWLALAVAGAAGAGSATDNFNVTATVPASLTIVAATDMAFGDLSGSEVTTAYVTLRIYGTVSVETPCYVTISAGGNASGGERKMSDGNGNTIGYRLYDRQTVGEGIYNYTEWGDDGLTHAGSGVNIVKNPSDNQSYTWLTVHGEADAFAPGQAAGSYTDNVLLTVTW
jgi:spore coat protein U-like protein